MEKSNSKYSKEMIDLIKKNLDNKDYKSVLIFYYSEYKNLPPFTAFLKALPDNHKEKIIKYLLFVEKNPFFERTNFLHNHFFEKLKINQKNKEFLLKREAVLKKIKQTQ